MRPTAAVILGASVLITATGVATAATTSSAATQVKACTDKHGALALQSRGHCPKGTKGLLLSAMGPVGAQGPQGIQGIAGIQGPPGPRGPGALSSLIHVTSSSPTSGASTSFDVPGTPLTVDSTCTIASGSQAASLSILDSSGPTYVEGGVDSSTTGTGESYVANVTLPAGGSPVATNSATNLLAATAGTGSGVADLTAIAIAGSEPPAPIVSVQASVISETDECLVSVIVTPTSAGSA